MSGGAVAIAATTHAPLWSRAHFPWAYLIPDSDPPMVQPGYLTGGCESPLSLDDFAALVGVSAWRLRCAVAELRNIERTEDARGRVTSKGTRVYVRLSRLLGAAP